jgi:hypothetical protein
MVAAVVAAEELLLLHASRAHFWTVQVAALETASGLA